MIRGLVVAAVLLSAVLLATAFLKPSQEKFNDEPSAVGGNSSPVVVELFTSEGCSSCPPADELLAKLDKQSAYAGVPVIALSEHVDYWDGLGWKDRFSSPAYTERQRQFGDRFALNSVYTPQMVVDGRAELVGNDEGALRQAVLKASRSAKPVSVELAWESSGKLRVSAADAGTHRGRVVLAITESDLTTSVQRGENGGRTLHHSAVVRRLYNLGSLAQGKFATTAAIMIDPQWKPENLKAVVFVQDASTDAILGATAIGFKSK